MSHQSLTSGDHYSGQIIAIPPDLTPSDGLVREMPLPLCSNGGNPAPPVIIS